MNRYEEAWKDLEKMKHCFGCKWHFDRLDMLNDGRCIPFSYCRFHKGVVDDRESCEHYERWDS